MKVAQSVSSQPHGLPARLLCPWNSPGQNSQVGSYSLLQEIFPIQGLNPGLPHHRQFLYRMSHQVLTKNGLSPHSQQGQHPGAWWQMDDKLKTLVSWWLKNVLFPINKPSHPDLRTRVCSQLFGTRLLLSITSDVVGQALVALITAARHPSAVAIRKPGENKGLLLTWPRNHTVTRRSWASVSASTEAEYGGLGFHRLTFYWWI